jgi:hypothetical protein
VQNDGTVKPMAMKDDLRGAEISFWQTRETVQIVVKRGHDKVTTYFFPDLKKIEMKRRALH